jgi:predicted tellurium resistance membrane protein TerC
MLTRIVLLLTISWIMGLRAELFRLHFDFWRVQLDQGFSGRDIILLVGGLFLIGKSAHEIFEKVEAGVEQEEIDGATEGARRAFGKGMTWVVGQIMVMDIIFSLDSVITAVGMVNQVPIMVAAIVVAIAIMMLFAKKVGEFVNNNPSMKILALSFLLLIGVLLTADGLGQHMNKGYIYFAMAFAVAIELLNMRLRNRRRRQTPPVSGQPRSV